MGWKDNCLLHYQEFPWETERCQNSRELVVNHALMVAVHEL